MWIPHQWDGEGRRKEEREKTGRRGEWKLEHWQSNVGIGGRNMSSELTTCTWDKVTNVVQKVLRKKVAWWKLPKKRAVFKGHCP